ncbi:MAG: sodium:alanine symporter family protein [Chlamydiales bacterium]|nr:sodium:alanine symporter family protein [Chlamydiales bacterium]
MDYLKSFGDFFLFLTTPIVLGASLLLTIKTRFIQFRKLPHMLRLFFSLIFKRHPEKEGEATVRAHKALFTAMSTTIGISTIVSPIIAIRIGGPGAILGFFIATLLGAAVNFTEVTFALSYRKHHPEKGVAGGPMQYLQDEIMPFLAKWYAFFTFIMLLGWSSAQANQLGAILSSNLIGNFGIPSWVTGALLAISITAILIGGIKRVSNFSAKLVPLMFIIYVGGSLWIILANFTHLPAIFKLVFQSAFAPQTFATGITVGGIVSALRWGVFKGLQSSEAGVGTQTIPHSMAETDGAYNQGILAMISTYSAGFICILSSLVALLTQTWLDPTLSLGIDMVAASFQSYFSTLGLVIVTASALLFAFGTILGNSYNGSQCFIYLTKHRFMFFYYAATAALIFAGTVMDAAVVWSMIDYLLVPVVIPHILSIVYLSYKQSALLTEEEILAEAI